MAAGRATPLDIQGVRTDKTTHYILQWCWCTWDCHTSATKSFIIQIIIEMNCKYYGWNMMTSSSGNVFRVTVEFSAQRPVTRCFVVFFDLRLDKRLSTQSWGWWFLRRHCVHYDVTTMKKLVLAWFRICASNCWLCIGLVDGLLPESAPVHYLYRCRCHLTTHEIQCNSFTSNVRCLMPGNFSRKYCLQDCYNFVPGNGELNFANPLCETQDVNYGSMNDHAK